MADLFDLNSLETSFMEEKKPSAITGHKGDPTKSLLGKMRSSIEISAARRDKREQFFGTDDFTAFRSAFIGMVSDLRELVAIAIKRDFAVGAAEIDKVIEKHSAKLSLEEPDLESKVTKPAKPVKKKSSFFDDLSKISD